MPGIAAVIITFNEEANIERCISSVLPVVDEVIVIDSLSSDNTAAIARKLGAKVFERPWEGYANAKNFGNAKAQSHFILSIDADEALSEELTQSILNEKENLLEAGYRFHRLTSYCGRWIQYSGWYPDPKLRLFPRSKANWEGDYVHESLILEPNLPILKLPGDLLHYSFDSISDHIQRLDKYSTLAAAELMARKKKISIAKLLLSPWMKFFKVFVLKQGFRDGLAGFTIAIISAFDIFIRYAKVRFPKD